MGNCSQVPWTIRRIHHDGCQPLFPAALCRIGNRCGGPEGSEQPTCRHTLVNAQSPGTPTHIVSRYIQLHILRPAEALAANASNLAFSFSRTDTASARYPGFSAAKYGMFDQQEHWARARRRRTLHFLTPLWHHAGNAIDFNIQLTSLVQRFDR